jgi:flavin reductase (DIM6/NTAB) family NADH-FMN oxidoreductase RutF
MADPANANILSHPAFLQPVERQRFIDAMGAAVTGVTVVTTSGGAGRAGVTVSAVSSVSADPPTLLACIHRESPACEAIRRNRIFCVNVLKSTQQHIAEIFAGRSARDAFDSKFDCAHWASLSTGAPVLSGALSVFDCRLQASQAAGTHEVFFGIVLGAQTSDGAPLLYAGRAYGRPDWFSGGQIP